MKLAAASSLLLSLLLALSPAASVADVGARRLRRGRLFRERKVMPRVPADGGGVDVGAAARRVPPAATEEEDEKKKSEEDDGEGTSLFQPETRIIGGGPSARGRYSYAASLQAWQGHFCGGSLILLDVVLSAAHCAQGAGRSYNAVVGRYDLDDRWEGQAIAKSLEVRHPRYSSATTNYDYMLVFLTRPVSAANGDVDLVRLNAASAVPRDGDEATVMGWGDTDPSPSVSSASDKLKEVSLNVLSNDRCERRSGRAGMYFASYAGKISGAMMCAEDDNEDSCQGDSGGALVIRGNDPEGGDDVQVGVVSWGLGCASPTFPGVYARVSAVYDDWIQPQVCARSRDPQKFERFGCPPDVDPCEGSSKSACGCDAAPLGPQSDYRGNVSVTASGRTCQAWTAQAPHEHARMPATYPGAGLDGGHNHCRNPDGDEGGAWCYTTDPGQRWEFCDVPSCDAAAPSPTPPAPSAPSPSPPTTPSVPSPSGGGACAGSDPSTCGCDGEKQADYRGGLAVTVSGRTCQAWDDQAPHAHSRTPENYPDAGLGGGHNRCRNPDGNDAAWCYTTDPGRRWELCAVPSCPADDAAPPPAAGSPPAPGDDEDSCEDFALRIQTGWNARGLSWTLDRVEGGGRRVRVADDPPEGMAYASFANYDPAASGCLPPADYVFAISDENGYGINPLFGFYRVTLGGNLLIEGSDFGSEDSISFAVEGVAGAAPDGASPDPVAEDIAAEDFATAYGIFNVAGPVPNADVRHYPEIFDRDGVVRLQNGGEDASIYSDLLVLNRAYSQIDVGFGFYAHSMERNDGFCLDYAWDQDTSWSEARCWRAIDDFENGAWYDDATVELQPGDGALGMRVRFRCDASSALDDVLIDSMTVRGWI